MIERRHLRDQVGDLIRDRIVQQRLPANQSIGEVALAEELGVSRTPVRETLLGLERDGFVRAVPGRGFIVLPLSTEEARQLYPIVWTLERLAISEMKEIRPEQIAQLRTINARLAAAATPEERTQCDTEWHRCLAAIGGNARLLAFLEGIKASIARYEYEFMNIADRRDCSVAEHEEIACLLEAAPPRTADAADAVEAQWRRGMDIVLAAIAAR